MFISAPWQVLLCESIENLSEEECLEVIRLMKTELECNTMNQLLIKIIMKMNDTFTINNTINLKKEIDSVLIAKKPANEKKGESKSNNKRCTTQQPQKTTTLDRKTTQNNNTFELLRLPIDMIATTSLFLNENDIINFEQCCRLFYTMINNSCYLNKTNNFKTFQVTAMRLIQMSDFKHSFYKFCKANTLMFKQVSVRGYFRDGKKLSSCFIQMWNKCINCGIYNDQWVKNMFLSIKKLVFNGGGVLLLPHIPTELISCQMQ